MKKYIAITCLSVLTFVSSGCKKPSETMDSSSWQRPAEQSISESYAFYRSSHVQNTAYTMHFSFTPDGDTFTAKNTIEFTLDRPSENLTIDYSDGVVKKFLVNGVEANTTFNGYYLLLPIEHLKTGKNIVTIEYVGNFSKDGSGLYRFIDPEDGLRYHYSDFEPYDAHRLFPCFDQPDIKATYTVTVDAPKDWVVISAQRETSRNTQNKKFDTWTFPTTKPFSTYIFSLHTGPYAEIAIQDYKDIELRLFVRKSLAKYVNAKDWESFTQHGFEFFQAYFDYPYPFTKYDQIIVPDFNAGAMENVGAVTFSERFISRGKKTHKERFRLANVILHEMAHMWFGNLVTMKWWNDLWLNESFATFAAYVASEKHPDFKDAWKQFAGTKSWAYETDDQVTTHPIEAHIESSAVAMTNFDGITYGKGASSLQQVSYLIGDTAFRDGVRVYFKKHAWKNTIRKDFTSALDEQSQQNLDAWSKEWLQTSGTNTLSTTYTCENNQIATFKVIQSAPKDHTTLRLHRNQIALLDAKLQNYKTIDTFIDGKTTSIEALVGQPCPSLVLLNANDKDFVKVALDEKSIDFLAIHISDIASETTRGNLWFTLWDMVKKNQLSIEKYTSIVTNHIEKEKDINVATFIEDTLTGGVYSVYFLLPHETEDQQNSRDKTMATLNQQIYKLFTTATPSSDFQKLWFNGFINTSQTVENQKQMVGWLQGKVKLPQGFTLDQDQRWTLVQKLQELDHKQYASLTANEIKRDPSSKGQEALIAANASADDMKSKKDLIAKLLQDKPLDSVAKKRAAIKALFPASQIDLLGSLEDDLYNLIVTVSNTPGQEILLSDVTRYIIPLTCNKEGVHKMGRFINEHKDLHPIAVKNLRIQYQENQDCVAIKETQEAAK